jgi:single-stranded-DNA-specific exonuclease
MSNPSPSGGELAACSLTGGRWVFRAADEDAVRGLSAALGIGRLTAHVLCQRGVTNSEEARRFLEHDLREVHDPFLMRDMDRAVELTVQAIAQRKPIRIYGDYDVDGVCATALMVRALGGLGAKADWYVPHRVDEGYGVNEEAIRRASADGVGLLITVDCGSSSTAQVALAQELGVEVIVTDHHRPGEELPNAPMLNPWRVDCTYPFKHLSGVGVAFKLVSGVARRLGVHEGHEHRTWSHCSERTACSCSTDCACCPSPGRPG